MLAIELRLGKMIKRLKKRLLLIYIVSIAFILGISLGILYINTKDHTLDEVNRRLDYEIKTSTGEIIKAPRTKGDESFKEQTPTDIPKFNDELIINNDDKSLKTIVLENFGSEYTINMSDHTITDGTNYYAFNKLEKQTKFLEITKDVNFIREFRFTLIKAYILIMIFICIFGYIFIKIVTKPVVETYNRQKEFVADASHELKTPLAVLKSCLKLIANNDEESDELIKYSQMEVDRLVKLTGNLLRLSEEDEPSNEVLDISYQTTLVLSGIEVQLFEKGIQFTSEIEDEIKVNISSEEYAQIVHILLDNATKYNDHRKKIKLSLKKNKNYAELQVVNTADYIKQEDLSKLFDRFYREDKSRNEKTKGFGLGLSIADHIVNKYRGNINVAYENGEFRIKVKLNLK